MASEVHLSLLGIQFHAANLLVSRVAHISSSRGQLYFCPMTFLFITARVKDQIPLLTPVLRNLVCGEYDDWVKKW